MAVTWTTFTDSNGAIIRGRYIPRREHPDGAHPSDASWPAFETNGHSFKKDTTGRVWFQRRRHLRSDTVSWWQPIEECDAAIRDLSPFGPCSGDPAAVTAGPPRPRQRPPVRAPMAVLRVRDAAVPPGGRPARPKAAAAVGFAGDTAL
jgi:hypothetical protein|eukprot:COSAG02_NODE_11255_length_1759_cov_1.305422_1_plen_148_part_00